MTNNRPQLARRLAQVVESIEGPKTLTLMPSGSRRVEVEVGQEEALDPSVMETLVERTGALIIRRYPRKNVIVYSERGMEMVPVTVISGLRVGAGFWQPIPKEELQWAYFGNAPGREDIQFETVTPGGLSGPELK